MDIKELGAKTCKVVVGKDGEIPLIDSAVELLYVRRSKRLDTAKQRDPAAYDPTSHISFSISKIVRNTVK